MNALDIPEIRASIGLHLDNASLVACVLVCRAWQASFEPYIWSDLLISSDESSSHPRPCIQGLRRNAHLTTRLALAGCPLEYLVPPTAAEEQRQSQQQRHPPEPVPDPIQPRPPPLLLSPHPRAPQQRSHGFCNLLRLVVSNSRNDRLPKVYWEAIATIISQNPRLNFLRISSLRPPPPVLWQAICSLRLPLQALHLFRLTIPPEHAHLLWDAFDNATSVRFIHTSLSPLPPQDTPQQRPRVFPRLERLYILEEQGLSSTALVDLISQCPNLHELQWNTNVGIGFPTELFLERLQQQPTLWPRLRQLRIPHEPLVEEQLYKILEATTDLESFSALYYHRHDPPPPHPYNTHMPETTVVQSEDQADKLTTPIRTLPSLARHFHTLRELSFSAPNCDRTSSIVMQTVLSSCPNLVSISGEVIRGVEIATGAPWVCLGLRSFYLDVDVAPHALGGSIEMKGSSRAIHPRATPESEDTSQKPSLISTPSSSSSSTTLSRAEIQKRVLHQLARLQRLQNLTLMSHRYSSSFSPISKSHRRGLELDLRHGLDHLAGMTELCSVYFSTIQNMDVEDAFWIAQHWKRLSSLTNRLHPDPILNQGLWEVCLRRRKDVVRLELGLGIGGSIEP